MSYVEQSSVDSDLKGTCDKHMNGNSSKIANVFAFCEYTTLQYKHKICTLSENIDIISTPVSEAHTNKFYIC